MGDQRFPNPELEYPVTIEDGTFVAVTIVAVAGKCDDWAAYVGPSYWDGDHVIDWGNKLDQATAEALFYDMAHSGRTWRR